MNEVDLEHRLTKIEESLESGFERLATEIRTTTIEVSELKTRVGIQNGRVNKLEDWKNSLTTRFAHDEGVKEGRASLSAAQLGFIAVFAPILFAAIDIAIRVFFG